MATIFKHNETTSYHKAATFKGYIVDHNKYQHEYRYVLYGTQLNLEFFNRDTGQVYYKSDTVTLELAGNKVEFARFLQKCIAKIYDTSEYWLHRYCFAIGTTCDIIEIDSICSNADKEIAVKIIEQPVDANQVVYRTKILRDVLESLNT